MGEILSFRINLLEFFQNSASVFLTCTGWDSCWFVGRRSGLLCSWMQWVIWRLPAVCCESTPPAAARWRTDRWRPLLDSSSCYPQTNCHGRLSPGWQWHPLEKKTPKIVHIVRLSGFLQQLACTYIKRNITFIFDMWSTSIYCTSWYFVERPDFGVLEEKTSKTWFYKLPAARFILKRIKKLRNFCNNFQLFLKFKFF